MKHKFFSVLAIGLLISTSLFAQRPATKTTTTTSTQSSSSSTANNGTAQQIAAIEAKVDVLTKKVDALQVRYEESLSENKSLKAKLGDKVPLARNEINGFVWEATSATRTANGVILEVVVTNTTEKTVDLWYQIQQQILVTDEFGDPAKEVDVINKNEADSRDFGNMRYHISLFPNAPFKFRVKANGISNLSNYIGSFVITSFLKDQTDNPSYNGIKDYSAVLLNIKID